MITNSGYDRDFLSAILRQADSTEKLAQEATRSNDLLERLVTALEAKLVPQEV